MPDLPTIAGGPSETGASAAASNGIAITANASANTKATTWTELITATDYATNWLLVSINTPSLGGVSTGYLVDIGVGTSTAEVVLIPDLLYAGSSATTYYPAVFLFPLRVPTGTRISARCQASTGAATLRVSVVAISGPIDAPPGMTRVEAAGISAVTSLGTSVDCGAVAHTDVVGQLIAATGFAYSWLCISLGVSADVTWAATRSFLIDICVGAGGSEVAVINDLHVCGPTGIDSPGPASMCFPVAIASGSRLSARIRSDGAVAGDRVMSLSAYGVG